MIKYFCDHCRKELSGMYNELDTEDTFYVEGKFVGNGCILCNECWEERNIKHAELDIEFLNLERKE